MTREEILRLALERTPDIKSAIASAREMEEFLKETPPLADLVAEAIHRPIARRKRVKLPNSNKPWTNQERLKAADLFNEGFTTSQVGELLGRSTHALYHQVNDDLIPMNEAAAARFKNAPRA